MSRQIIIQIPKEDWDELEREKTELRIRLQNVGEACDRYRTHIVELNEIIADLIAHRRKEGNSLAEQGHDS